MAGRGGVLGDEGVPQHRISSGPSRGLAGGLCRKTSENEGRRLRWSSSPLEATRGVVGRLGWGGAGRGGVA